MAINLAKIVTVTKVCHGNGDDSNGNPRRLFLVQEVTAAGARRLEVIEESYDGNDAWKKKYPNAVFATTFDVTPAMYRIYKNMVGKELN